MLTICSQNSCPTLSLADTFSMAWRQYAKQNEETSIRKMQNRLLDFFFGLVEILHLTMSICRAKAHNISVFVSTAPLRWKYLRPARQPKQRSLSHADEKVRQVSERRQRTQPPRSVSFIAYERVAAMTHLCSQRACDTQILAAPPLTYLPTRNRHRSLRHRAKGVLFHHLLDVHITKLQLDAIPCNVSSVVIFALFCVLGNVFSNAFGNSLFGNSFGISLREEAFGGAFNRNGAAALVAAGSWRRKTEGKRRVPALRNCWYRRSGDRRKLVREGDACARTLRAVKQIELGWRLVFVFFLPRHGILHREPSEEGARTNTCAVQRGHELF